MEIKEKIDKGYIHFNSIVEVLGKPKKHVEDTIREYVKKIKKNNKIKVLKEEYSEAKKIEEGENLFAVFVEIEALTKDSSELVFFCFDYMPSSIEIIEPEELKYIKSDFSGFLNDLQARLHTIDMALKQYKARNELLIKNSAILLRNMVRVILEKEEKTKEEIAKKIGIPLDRTENVLKAMQKEKIVKKKGKKYMLK